MRNHLMYPVIVCLLSACSAAMVTPPGGGVQLANAPVNEASRPGVIRYLNQGATSIRMKRRQDAYNQMQKACDGAYSIDSESEKADGSRTSIEATSLGIDATTHTSKYWYIAFHCAKPS
jgi:hypothetical protein